MLLYQRRFIVDNILLSYEIVHAIKKRRRGKKGLMSLKLDMRKVYDRIEWCFLEQIMLKLGFDQ